ncbi:tyrosine-type recombinase/integrase [Paenibacillus sp. N1-5-1-14]|uniref:tyrosine-type recombinase/integrase n=1 Tax=Paenibacillus radicibacter TaxID=2972488 RepID=UPI002158A789|nr:tyrosine-type recombinase/integrase [Paenibacillus radicibacter]MCR8641101.1 tyrosine-type recombinase/integrase [Paenibacillus radicibacter]
MNTDIWIDYESYLKVFQVWMDDAGYTSATQKAYIHTVQDFLKQASDKQVEKMNKLDIMTYLTRARRKGVSDQTRNRKLFAIRSFFKSLKDMEMVEVNPAMDVKLSKTERNQLPVFLEENDLSVFLKQIEGRYSSRNIAIFLLMAYAGLRVGEVHRLNIADFHQERGSLHVMGKGRKWRAVPLPGALAQILGQVLGERRDPNRSIETSFFISQKGYRLSIRQIQTIAQQTFTKLQEQEGQEGLQDLKLSCHKLRHSFATMMLRQGTDIRIVKELMGHESIETTMIYTHVSDSQREEAMQAIQLPDLQLTSG